MAESKRLLSLDVFRGLTMAAMVLLENPGTTPVYRHLRHSAWGESITFKDCIMPAFLFILGLSITVSFTKRAKARAGRFRLFRKIAVRSLTLLLLGLLLHLFYFALFEKFRIPGVLQRIAVVYFISASLFLISTWRSQLVITAAILLCYWGLMTLIPVPGMEKTGLEPETNLAAHLDRAVFGEHLRNEKSDPQGLLGTLPAICFGLIGMLAGHWLLREKKPLEKTAGFLVAGILLIILGRVWAPAFPIIRDINTSSFVLYTTGLAMLAWGACYFLVECLGMKWWTKPFAAYGVSCIFVFMASHILAVFPWIIRIPIQWAGKRPLQEVIMKGTFPDTMSPQNASLIFASIVVLLWLIPLWVMYNRRIIIKI